MNKSINIEYLELGETFQDFPVAVLDEERVIINIEELTQHLLTTYNGYWAKTISGLDKTKTNGYSLLGTFVKNLVSLPLNVPLVLCGIGGSRKNQIKRYSLLYFDGEKLVVVMNDYRERDYAIRCWDLVDTIKNR